MKKFCIILLGLLLISCENNEQESEFTTIEIRKKYSYSIDNELIEEIDKNKLELFNQKIFLFNTYEQLEENSLFKILPDLLKIELETCDFEKHTLIIASSSSINFIDSISYSFVFNNFLNEYEYSQNMYARALNEPIESIDFSLVMFCIDKIRTDSRLKFSRAIIIND